MPSPPPCGRDWCWSSRVRSPSRKCWIRKSEPVPPRVSGPIRRFFCARCRTITQTSRRHSRYCRSGRDSVGEVVKEEIDSGNLAVPGDRKICSGSDGIFTAEETKQGWSCESRYPLTGILVWDQLKSARLPNWALPILTRKVLDRGNARLVRPQARVSAACSTFAICCADWRPSAPADLLPALVRRLKQIV